MTDTVKINEIIPKSGIVYNERVEFPEVLCKPKILPLKSVTLKKLEQLEKNFEASMLQNNNTNKEK